MPLPYQMLDNSSGNLLKVTDKDCREAIAGVIDFELTAGDLKYLSEPMDSNEKSKAIIRLFGCPPIQVKVFVKRS